RKAASAAGSTPRRGWAGAAALAVLAGVLGLVTVAAAQQLRAPQAEIAEARQQLEDQIVERQAVADGLRDRSGELSAGIDELQHETLASQDPALLRTLRVDSAVNGTSPVAGPGLVVTLADGGGGLSDTESEPGARVRDVDVQTVVNALWSSGAEAIEVDGQ